MMFERDLRLWAKQEKSVLRIFAAIVIHPHIRYRGMKFDSSGLYVVNLIFHHTISYHEPGLADTIQNCSFPKASKMFSVYSV
jgi:hypothetical protein